MSWSCPSASPRPIAAVLGACAGARPVRPEVAGRAARAHRGRRWLQGLGSVLLLAVAGGAAAQETDTGDWLGRMAKAMRNADYEGTLVYAYGAEMETLSVVHAVIDGREHERIRALTGEPFEIIRNGETIRCFWPTSERALRSQQPASLLPSGLPQGLQSLPGLYTAEVEEETTRIAGRIARVLRVHSTDEFRYGYRLWIDRESDVLLRSDLVAPDGEVVERLMFTRFEVLQSVDPGRFEPTHAEREYVEYSAPEPGPGTMDDPRWQVSDLPPGFHTVGHRVQRMPGGRSVQQSVFSDGLASVSVFIEPVSGPAPEAGAPDPFEGPAGMGAISAYITRSGAHAITAVGEVPAVTVRRIARAVERGGQQASN